jgi:hypothetical protein
VTPSLNFLVTQVAARMRVPDTGGNASNPEWVMDKRIAFGVETWMKLDKLATELSRRGVARIKPHQLAALIMELVMEEVEVSPQQKAEP